MLAQERQLQILQLVEEKGTVRTTDLARGLEVTDETIRRDLQALADHGLLNKVHGGATSLSGRPKLQSFTERRALNVHRKEAIARLALAHVRPGQTIAFDSSTSVFELVRILPDLPFRVFTNAHPVLHQLIDAENIELVSTGGRYQRSTQTFLGPEGRTSLARHNINQAFVSCVGLDLQSGASEAFEQQAVFKEALVEAAERVVLMVDSTKLGRRSEYFFAPLGKVHLVITDDDADPAIIARLAELGIAVETTPSEAGLTLSQ